jgi:hypothetical protein
VPKVGEGDGVLDEDGVVLGAAHERAVVAQRQLVDLDRAPGLDLARVRSGGRIRPKECCSTVSTEGDRRPVLKK